MRRIAVVTSHPIQYQAPWFRALAEVCDLRVFFGHMQTPAGQARAGFGEPFDWDLPLLDGYRSEWLQNIARTPGVDRFAECDTPGVADALAAGSFDACIVNGWYLKSYLQAIRACRTLGVPVLVRGDSQLAGPRAAWKAAAKYLPYRWFLSRVDAHLYVGRANLEYLRHYGVPDGRLFFVPHFVDNDRFANDAERARQSGGADRLRASWGASAATTVFLFAGKLIGRKRPADLIDAVSAVSRQGLDVRGVVVGSGPEETALRARASAMGAPIVFAGFQNQSHIGRWYAAADCLVLPSDGRETWGLVVNEGMATGLPAIVSDAVGCGSDLIDEGATGSTYPVGDGTSLAEHMLDMVIRLREQAPQVRAAVLTKIRGYSCACAVQGTVRAVEAVLSRTPHDRERAAEAQHA